MTQKRLTTDASAALLVALIGALAGLKQGYFLPAFAVVAAGLLFAWLASDRRRSSRELRERVVREQEDEIRRRQIAEANARLDEKLERDVSPLEARLRRNGRGLHEWMKDLRSVSGGEARGFRNASIPPDALWAIVEDDAADHGARAAAAMVIRRELGENAGERLRIVARETESPKLRVAVLAVAEAASGEEQAEALREVGD